MSEVEDSSAHFTSMLNYLKESINAYNPFHKSEWESDFSISISDYHSSALTLPLEIFLRYCSI